LQARVPVEVGDSADSLAGRVLGYEHQIYPKAAQWFCQGRLAMDAGVAVLDGKPLDENGVIFNQASEQ
jgi:phosphoribosylglycinamide formyltransferase-1